MARATAGVDYWITPRLTPEPHRRPQRKSKKSKTVGRAGNTPVFQPSLLAKRQASCPLFKLLPELRNIIFRSVFAFVWDIPYPHSLPVYYSSDKLPHPKAHTALIRTCPLIYRETRFTIAAANTHTIFYPRFRVYFLLPNGFAKNYFSRMPTGQLAAVQNLHIIADRRRLKAKEGGSYYVSSALADLGALRAG